MLIEAVEVRFGSTEGVPEDHTLEFLSDNGGAYIATDTKAIARSLGLKPITTPVFSPQSNGIAESFVNTFRRDYVAHMDRSSAVDVLRSCRPPSSTSTACSALELEDDVAQRVQTTSAPSGVKLRIGRVRQSEGKTILITSP